MAAPAARARLTACFMANAPDHVMHIGLPIKPPLCAQNVLIYISQN